MFYGWTFPTVGPMYSGYPSCKRAASYLLEGEWALACVWPYKCSFISASKQGKNPCMWLSMCSLPDSPGSSCSKEWRCQLCFSVPYAAIPWWCCGICSLRPIPLLLKSLKGLPLSSLGTGLGSLPTGALTAGWLVALVLCHEALLKTRR